MPLGYGYIRDDEPAIVDWAAITKDARESIKKIEEDRQKKREGVDQAVRDQSEALINRPKSQNVQYNTAMSNMTSQIEARMLQNYNDLRLGNINLNQFNATKNTMMSETKGVLAIAKTYAEQYDANVEGAQNGTLSGYSNWTNAMTQEMMDFQGVETYVGPNGKISFVKKREDGTTETLDTSELFTLANMKQQKFDMEEAITKAKSDVEFAYIDQFGKTVKGYFIDPLTKSVNEDAISTAAKGIVAQDSNAYGILYDYKGGYDFERLSDDFYTQNQTREEQEAALKELHKDNPNTIYVDINGMPVVSKEQRDEAQKYMEDRLRTQAVTGIQEAEYRKQESIDAQIAYTQSQTNTNTGVEQTAFDVLVQQVNRDFNFAEDAEQIAQDIEAGTYTFPIDKYKAILQFYNLEFRETAMKDPNNLILYIKNPIDPAKLTSDIKIDLTNTPPSQWQALFRRKFTGIPGYTEYLASMAKGDISTATFPQGGSGGGGGASNFNKPQ